MGIEDSQWHPFRPTELDLARIANEVAEIRPIQQKMVECNKELRFPERVAHEYQIVGSRVIYQVARELPETLSGISLFQPGAEHQGIGRISTGLGIPHAETLPDFLGIMVAFQTAQGQRVDFLGINDPSSPADNHRDFMDVLFATAESANAESFLAEQSAFAVSLIHRMGPIQGAGSLAHLTRQTSAIARSSTAFQRYWTGIVEVGGTGGKFTFVPVIEENHFPGLFPEKHHLSADWSERQASGDVEFILHWIPFLDEARTSTRILTRPWEESHKHPVGRVRFPRMDPTTEESDLWAILASEMGANPGNWVADREGTIREPATEFGVARKIAYQKIQEGRNALPPSSYAHLFLGKPISAELTAELRERRQAKLDAGHVNRAP